MTAPRKRHAIFAATSAAWLAIFFAIGFHHDGTEAGVTIAAIAYLVPFGGLWCCAILAYYP